MQVATFFVAEGLYGVPVSLVEEFFRTVPVTPVPKADERVAGLINLRGNTAAVIDLRRALGHEPAPVGAKSKMIMMDMDEDALEAGEAPAGGDFREPVVLLVDRVHRIVQVNAEEIHPAPAHITHQFVDGVVKFDGQYMTILSLPRLVDDILVKGA